MSIKDLILRIVDKQHIDYEIFQAPDEVSLRENWLESTVPLDSVGRLSFLEDEKGVVLSIYPASYIINLPQLRNALGRALHFIDKQEFFSVLAEHSKQPGFDLSRNKHFQFIVDEHLTNQDIVHFESRGACNLLRMDSTNLDRLAEDVLVGFSFSEPCQPATTPSLRKNPLSIRERMARIERLPAMPEMPRKILAIRNNPNSSIDDLVEIIEQDLVLSAQILRYANSALFRNNEAVNSLKDAIFRVLGYETVLHLSLGYALGRVFRLPENGPLGHEQFWRHSTFSAALCQQLAAAMPRQLRPKPGLAYLAGLLHDIGFLVLHMLFKNEHTWLNKMITANPDRSILEMEQRLLGIDHSELGYWLTHQWGLPEELCVTVQQHHNPAYDGPHAEYARLLNLSERLLKTHGMSDATSDELPAELLQVLGLEEEEVIEITDEVLQGGATLNEMAGGISAG